MHTFRFNPVFHQWVLLGTSYSATPHIENGHLLDVGRKGKFVAASHPKQPFLVEPDGAKDHGDLVYEGKAPVGEYELLLYTGKDPLATWDTKEWEGWLELAQLRIRQARHNPHLHFVSLTVHTGVLDSVDNEEFQRVGEVIATSHPLCGMSTLIDREIAAKMRAKEQIFIVQDDGYGTLIVPSAPLRQHEVWYLPTTVRGSFGDIEPGERKAMARTLSHVVSELKSAYSHEEFLLTFHTGLMDNHPDRTWWLQIHRAEAGTESPLPVRALPELFVRKLSQLLV